MFDCDGWADASKVKPELFDLCSLKTEKKTVTGWWSGCIWDGLNIKDSEQVLYWKYKKAENYAG